MALLIQRGQPSPAADCAADQAYRFAYLGPAGTFTEQALRSVPEAVDASLLPASTAAEALSQVRSGTADAAMLPVHNTVSGLVPDTVRALVEFPAPTVLREVVLGVDFALLVRPGAALSQARVVSGHPHARAQVDASLKRLAPQARWVPAPSNAEAARQVRDGRYDAAVAGEFTAGRYGLDIAARRLQDMPGAVTRFLLVARSGTAWAPGPSGTDRTSLVARLDGGARQAGSLVERLRGHRFLRSVSLDLVRHDGTRSDLFVDCPEHAEHPSTARAVGLLRLRVPGLRSLGSYPAAAVTAPPHTSGN